MKYDSIKIYYVNDVLFKEYYYDSKIQAISCFGKYTNVTHLYNFRSFQSINIL